MKLINKTKRKDFKEKQQWEIGSTANLKIIIEANYRINSHLLRDQVDIIG